MSTTGMSQASSLVESQLDEQFIVYMLEIDSRYKSMVKNDRTRVEQWSKVLCQANSSVVWKKNRNLYAMQLLDSVLNNFLIKPFSLPPPQRATMSSVDQYSQVPQAQQDSHDSSNDFVLPALSKTQVVSQLSIRFKHLKLEVDKQKIVSQLAESQNSEQQQLLEDNFEMIQLQSYSEEGDQISQDEITINRPQHQRNQTSQSNSSRLHTQQVMYTGEDLDENPRPQQPNSVVRPKGTQKQQKSLKRTNSRRKSIKSQPNENMERNFQQMQQQLMLQQAEEQLKQYDFPRPQSEVVNLKEEVIALREQNREYACQVAQLQTQIEVQQIAAKHQNEQVQVKDQMLAMQEDMLNQLNAEVEKLKLMLLAKNQSVLQKTATVQEQKHKQQQQEDNFQSESTQRMVNTAKAQVPPVIFQDAGYQGKTNGHKGKQLIVPEQLQEAKRQHKQQRFNEYREITSKNQDNEFALIKSHVSVSDCDERSVHLDHNDSRGYAVQERTNQHTISNDDGATLQLQNYIKSVNDEDLNFLQDSSMLLSQKKANQNMVQLAEQKNQRQDDYTESSNNEEMMFSDSDRFLAEVILSKKPQYDKQTKNDFLPKTAALQPIQEGEMSLQDLSNNDISVLTKGNGYQMNNRTQHVCNKTVDCSCGCEDESFAHVNRTQQDVQDMKRLKEQREFFAQINTEIANCTQDDSQLLQESRATSNGSPARLLDQLLASQGASAFQPQFNYKKHLAQEEAKNNRQANQNQMPQSIHDKTGDGTKDEQKERAHDMPMAQQSLATESQFERFYTDLIT